MGKKGSPKRLPFDRAEILLGLRSALAKMNSITAGVGESTISNCVEGGSASVTARIAAAIEWLEEQ